MVILWLIWVHFPSCRSGSWGGWYFSHLNVSLKARASLLRVIRAWGHSHLWLFDFTAHSLPGAAATLTLSPPFTASWLPTPSFKLTQSRGWPCPINHLLTQTQLIFGGQSNSLPPLITVESHTGDALASFASIWNELWLKCRLLPCGISGGPLTTTGDFVLSVWVWALTANPFPLLLRASFQG